MDDERKQLIAVGAFFLLAGLAWLVTDILSQQRFSRWLASAMGAPDAHGTSLDELPHVDA